jgi:uncharacterized protein
LTNLLKYLYYTFSIASWKHNVKIRVADITDKQKTLEAVEEFSRYPALASVQEAGDCKFSAPLTVSLAVAREYDHIRVHGAVNTSIVLTCSRCLAEHAAAVESRFTIFYTRADGNQPEDEVELGEEDLISAAYSGDEIDFDDEIAAQVLLEIPYKPLCSEECRGLCPDCGADLNNSACSCSDKRSSMAFSTLKGLKVKQ